jgi:hypothetical protein
MLLHLQPSADNTPACSRVITIAVMIGEEVILHAEVTGPTSQEQHSKTNTKCNDFLLQSIANTINN